MAWYFWYFSNTGNLFWYLVIIVVGISLILRHKNEQGRRSGRAFERHFGNRQFSAHPTSEEGNQDEGFNSYLDVIDEVAIFGGGKRIIHSANFRGGDIVTIFGGMDLFFEKSQLAPGTQQIEAVSIFGGWTLVVPPHWNVKIDVVSIFGSINDKRSIPTEAARDNTSQLVITGFVMFGGGYIKSY
ncbi:MAG: cell wall-active antibiotics response protein [Cyclobacteriaceae bacterium]|nr:cell wall-active antibiotics response protein [Cyclobacteriaceae bacterium]